LGKFPEKLKEAQVVPLLQIYVDLKRFSSLQLSSKEQFDTHIQNGKQISKGEKFY
jgi:hypothetical protein